jgi:hypothetical protein
MIVEIQSSYNKVMDVINSSESSYHHDASESYARLWFKQALINDPSNVTTYGRMLDEALAINDWNR